MDAFYVIKPDTPLPQRVSLTPMAFIQSPPTLGNQYSDDRVLRAYLEHHRLPYVVAANKVDKLGRGEARLIVDVIIIIIFL